MRTLCTASRTAHASRRCGLLSLERRLSKEGELTPREGELTETDGLPGWLPEPLGSLRLGIVAAAKGVSWHRLLGGPPLVRRLELAHELSQG